MGSVWRGLLPVMLIVASGCSGCGDDDVPMMDGGLEDAALDALPDAEPVDIPNPVLVQTQAPDQVRAGESIPVTCIIIDENGDPYSAMGRTPVYRIAPEDSVIVEEDGTLRAAQAGEVEISCTFPDLMLTDDAPAFVEIVPGDPAEVVTELEPAQIEAGESASVDCVVFDAYGNRVLDAEPTMRAEPEDGENEIAGLTGTFRRAGRYDVACELAGATTVPERLEVLPSTPASLAIGRVPEQAVYAIGQVVEVAAVVSDQYGNVIEYPALTYSSRPRGEQLGESRFRYNSDGTYTVTVSVDPPTLDDVPLTASTQIVVNGSGPSIQCNGPADGAFVDAVPGTVVSLRARVEDVSGISTVTVDGSPVRPAADGSIVVPIETRFGVNFVDIVARDTFGVENSRTCAFLVSNHWGNEGRVQNDVVSLRLGMDAIDDRAPADLDSLNDILHRVLNSDGIETTLDTALRAANPLKPMSCDSRVLGVCVLRTEVTYNNGSASLGSGSSSLRLRNGGLSTDIRLNNVVVGLRVRNRSGIINTSGTVSFDFVEGSADMNMGISGGRPSVSIVGSSVRTNVGRVRTNFSGLDGAIINIIVRLAQGTVQRAVEDLVANVLRNQVNDALDGLVSGLSVDSLGSTFNVPTLGSDETIPLSFGVNFSSLNANSSRLLFGIGTRFTAPRVVARSAPGVALPPGVRGALLDDSASSASTTVSVHTGLFNQVMHALWRGGLLNARVTGDGLGGLPAGLSADLNGQLPPVAMMRPDGQMEISIGALNLALIYPGLFEQPVRVTLGARATTNVTLAGEDLNFGRVTITELAFSTGDVSLDAETRATLEGFLRRLVQVMVDNLLNDSLPAIPIPSFPIPASLAPFGLPAGERLGITSPALRNEPQHFVLRGGFGVVR